MRFRFTASLPIAGVVALVWGCSSAPAADVAARAGSVQVYEMNPFLGKPYAILGHIWADSSQTATRITTYATKDEAVASLQLEAARLNADALISVSCIDQHGSTWSQGKVPAFLCYGVAVRLRPNQG